MSRPQPDMVRLIQDATAAEIALTSRIGLFDAACAHAAPALVETTRADAHAALDALLDAKARYRHDVLERWRKEIR